MLELIGGLGKEICRLCYHSVISRRTNQQGLDDAVKNIEKEGGSATGFLINAIEEKFDRKPY